MHVETLWYENISSGFYRHENKAKKLRMTLNFQFEEPIKHDRNE